MATRSPLLTLNNGVRMPALGLGVYQSAPEDTVPAVVTALQDGYRLIDTAAAYGNESEVGEGLRRSGVDRDEVFVTTKVWMTDYGYDATLRAFDTSLAKLGLERLDLYLLHWPVPSAQEQTVASYRAAEKLLADGRARAIGVCNHNPAHLLSLMERTDIVPAVNQVELHPHFTQAELRTFDAAHGIVTQSWSPIGGANRYLATEGTSDPLQDRAVTALAAKYGKTPAQVVLRWHLEHGLSPIPKSVKPHRIAENFGVFDFALAPDEVAALDALDTGVRGGPDPEQVGLNTL
ncbi:aldo/keto reductase [Streptomyces iconiensis]|uniref:Aldo/keto reductase n=1 Tax=Streptomyces iconiensis TaxID=1384038 RepID=A0ABT7A2X8_9ACTN|nr:aldo/keto reductase [Streptomyces iconiensis]MDJ1135674.1 aldo/keto reductase [Streptomyces iconiensis]